MDIVIEKGNSTLPGELPASSAASTRDDHMTSELSYVIILVITARTPKAEHQKKFDLNGSLTAKKPPGQYI